MHAMANDASISARGGWHQLTPSERASSFAHAQLDLHEREQLTRSNQELVRALLGRG